MSGEDCLWISEWEGGISLAFFGGRRGVAGDRRAGSMLRRCSWKEERELLLGLRRSASAGVRRRGGVGGSRL